MAWTTHPPISFALNRAWYAHNHMQYDNAAYNYHWIDLDAAISHSLFMDESNFVYFLLLMLFIYAFGFLHMYLTGAMGQM